MLFVINLYSIFLFSMIIPVILLNYNSSADCRKCVAFLKRQECVALEIVIVDNCSQEDEYTAVKTLCERESCTFIPAKENRGYNAGNNIGLRYAAKKGYKYALIANPDMEFPQHDYIATLLSVMEEKQDVAVCGSNIIDTYGNRQSPKRHTSYSEELLWPIHGIWRRFLRKQLILDGKNQYCDILMGSCIFVRMSFIEEIGYFDESVFLYCEEVILGKQVKKLGMKMYYCHDISALHAHHESTKGSFVKRHDVYWRSRWYYLTHYAGYNSFQLSLMWLSKKIFYSVKRIEFIIKGRK